MRQLVIALALLLLCGGALRAADDVEALKKRVAEVEQEVIELKARSVPYSALVGDDIHITCWNLFAGGGGFVAQVRRALSLTDDESKRLDAAIAKARAGMADALAALGPRPVVADGGMTLDVPPFPAGAAVEKELRARILDVLGKDRAAFFNKLSGDRLGDRLLKFGKETYVFTIRPAGGQFETKVEHKSNGGSGSTSGTTPKLGDEFELVLPYIPAEYGGGGAAPATPAEPAPAKNRGEF